MNPSIMLNEVQIEEIRKLARDKRGYLSIAGEVPIANDIFTILEQLDIILLEYPINSEGDNPAFSAAIMYSEENNKELAFIGLNTAAYFDKQVFAIAHELYHYFTKTGSHLSRLDDVENNLVEAKANRFAAEFLFPEVALKKLNKNWICIYGKDETLKSIRHFCNKFPQIVVIFSCLMYNNAKELN
jgi:Zn-dependent peptidase ImmA (M78 family)